MARKPAVDGFPTRSKLIEATFKALLDCNGSATNQEIMDVVIRNEKLPKSIVDIIHADGSQTKLGYELRWARTYLKSIGIISNSKRGVWVICPDYTDKATISGQEIVTKFREKNKDNVSSDNSDKETTSTDTEQNIPVNEEKDPEPWREELSNVLHEMNPYAFEALSARVLRECGFSTVKVTSRSRDGGIDGIGKLRLNGLISMNVAFQCKRYKGAVSAPQIRDFRGSIADCEKGIMITTGYFTEDAKKEATCPGKQQIDLIDGEAFIDLLIENEIGVHQVVTYAVDKEFINNPEKFCE